MLFVVLCPGTPEGSTNSGSPVRGRAQYSQLITFIIVTF